MHLRQRSTTSAFRRRQKRWWIFKECLAAAASAAIVWQVRTWWPSVAAICPSTVLSRGDGFAFVGLRPSGQQHWYTPVVVRNRGGATKPGKRRRDSDGGPASRIDYMYYRRHRQKITSDLNPNKVGAPSWSSDAKRFLRHAAHVDKTEGVEAANKVLQEEPSLATDINAYSFLANETHTHAQHWIGRALNAGIEPDVNSVRVLFRAAVNLPNAEAAQLYVLLAQKVGVTVPKKMFRRLIKACLAVYDVRAAAGLLHCRLSSGQSVSRQSFLDCMELAKAAGEAEVLDSLYVLSDMSGTGTPVSRAALGDLLKAATFYKQLSQQLVLMVPNKRFRKLVKTKIEARDVKGAAQLLQNRLSAGETVSKRSFMDCVNLAADCGKLEAAEQLFDMAIKSGMKPDAPFFGALMKASLKANKPEKTRYWFGMAEAAGFEQNEQLLGARIEAELKVANIKSAEATLQSAMRWNKTMDVRVAGRMLDYYSRVGDGQKAEELLGKILAMNTELSIAQYHQMMQAYAWSNEKVKIQYLFNAMLTQGLVPERRTRYLMQRVLGRPRTFQLFRDNGLEALWRELEEREET